MRIILTALIIFLAATVPAMAQPKPLQISLAEDRVDITTGFNGTRITLYGTKTINAANIVVTLKGPERKMIVRRKARKVTGAWMNDESMEFRRVPSYYDFASTLDQEALNEHPELMKEGQIGIEYLDFYAEDENEDPRAIDVYRDALVRSEQRKGFYPLRPRPVQFIHRDFFKVSFDLPPGVPTGLYKVEALLVEGGNILARESQSLQVGQVGFNAKVYVFATDHSFFYGIVAIFIAVISGWSAFTFLRRD